MALTLNDEALAKIEAGLKAEPADPLNLSWYQGIALTLLEELRYQRGLAARLRQENETLCRREIDREKAAR